MIDDYTIIYFLGVILGFLLGILIDVYINAKKDENTKKFIKSLSNENRNLYYKVIKLSDDFEKG